MSYTILSSSLSMATAVGLTAGLASGIVDALVISSQFLQQFNTGCEILSGYKYQILGKNNMAIHNSTIHNST
jgi:hypothetical protein